MPSTATKLLSLLDDPDVSFSQIEGIIRYDPGLTANILKLTNSAYFGIPLKVSSVKQAMTLLGWKRLIQLVMTLCMSTLMKKPVPGYDLPRGERLGSDSRQKSKKRRKPNQPTAFEIGFRQHGLCNHG